MGRIAEGVTPLHDEQVLVVVSQDGISRSGIRQIVVVERFRNPRHEDIVQVDEVDTMLALTVVLAPAISPGTCHNTSVKLGTILVVVHQGDFADSMTAATEIPANAWELEIRERQRHLGTILQIVLVVVTFQSAYRLEGTT